MVNAPEDYICFEADYDLDGLPDDFEGNITIFNGNTVYSDPIVRDTYGDGLTDGEEIELKRTYRNNRTEVSVYAFLHSDPNDHDCDGDGIMDADDYWEANPIWSEDNPADLRYKALNPLVKNTLETLYPEINESYNENDAKCIKILGNTIHIKVYMKFNDNANTLFDSGAGIDNTIYNNILTYKQVAIKGMEEKWTTTVLGSDYDFVKGMTINVEMDIVPLESSSTHNCIWFDLSGDFAGIPHTNHNPISWSPTSTGTIYLNKADSRQEIPYHFNGIDFEGYAAHELGHILGLGDAYKVNDDGVVLGETSEVNPDVYQNSNIMYHNHIVYANDVEMVLEAFSTGEYQYYLTRHEVYFLIIGFIPQTKSSVIRQFQTLILPS